MIAYTDMNSIKDDFTQNLRLSGELPEVIERSISDFDRSFHGPISKAQAAKARKKVDSFVDKVSGLIRDGQKIISTLLYGTASEVDELKISDTNVTDFKEQLGNIRKAQLKVKYSFFTVSSRKEWSPHLSDLNYMQRKAMTALDENLSVSHEMISLVPHFIEKSEEDFVELSPRLEASIESNIVLTPEWV